MSSQKQPVKIFVSVTLTFALMTTKTSDI